MPRARSSSPSAAATRRGHHHIPRSGRPRTHRTQRGRRLSGNEPNGSWTTPAHGDNAYWSADQHGDDREIQPPPSESADGLTCGASTQGFKPSGVISVDRDGRSFFVVIASGAWAAWGQACAWRCNAGNSELRPRSQRPAVVRRRQVMADSVEKPHFGGRIKKSLGIRAALYHVTSGIAHR